MTRRFRDFATVIAFVVICLSASGLGAAVTVADSGSWYDGLAKATWNPPPWVFGPVWTALYVMMAIAAWFVWRTGPSSGRRRAMAFFAAQLVLNVLWSYLFFGFRLPVAALVEMALLWTAIAATIVVFRPLSRVAAWLLFPYLIWVSYALTLNGAIVVLN